MYAFLHLHCLQQTRNVSNVGWGFNLFYFLKIIMPSEVKTHYKAKCI